VEFHSLNPEQSAHFFSQQFGWMHTIEENGYYQFKKNDILVAGMAKREETPESEQFSNTTLYFGSQNVDLLNDKIKEHGGTVIKEPSDVFDKGRMGLYKDPAGALFGVWQAKNHKGIPKIDHEKQHGLPCLFEINTKNADLTKSFYSNVFGFDTVETPYQGNEYTYFFKDNELVGGMHLMTEEYGNMPSHWLAYYFSDHVDLAAEKVKELGGSVNIPPTDLPRFSRFTLVSDPFKVNLAVIGRNIKDAQEILEENDRYFKEILMLKLRLKKNNGNVNDNVEMGDVAKSNEDINLLKRKREEEEINENNKKMKVN
jgi:predicted enzyme related to lactoylglutathione lyase